jgi:hypothetical protein
MMGEGDNGYCGGTVARVGGVEEASAQGERETMVQGERRGGDRKEQSLFYCLV